MQFTPLLLQQQRDKTAASRNQQAAERGAVDPVAGVQIQPQRRRQAGQQQHQIAESARQPLLLAQADPHHAGGFQRPGTGGPLRRQGQRDRQRGENRPQRDESLAQQGFAVVAPRQPRRQRQIKAGQCQRAECGAEFPFVHQPHLQAETDNRRAEHQRRIDIIRPPAVAQLREQQRHQHVDQEKRQQEWLGGRIQLRPVLQHTPAGRDAESKQEADHVQRPPRLVACNRDNAAIQQQVITEQRHVAAVAGRSQQRRHETAGTGDHRQRARILPQRQQGRQPDHRQ